MSIHTLQAREMDEWNMKMSNSESEWKWCMWARKKNEKRLKVTFVYDDKLRGNAFFAPKWNGPSLRVALLHILKFT